MLFSNVMTAVLVQSPKQEELLYQCKGSVLPSENDVNFHKIWERKGKTLTEN